MEHCGIGYTRGHFAAPVVLDTVLETAEYRFEHLDTRKALVIRFYDRPRAVLGAGTFDHLARSDLVVVSLGPIAVVLLRYLELFVGRLLTLLETPKLLVGSDVEPKLDENHPAVDELILEVVDLFVRAAPLCFLRKLLDTLDEYAPVPATIVD